MDGAEGATAIDFKTAVTVSASELDTADKVTMMLAVPALSAVTNPAAETLATAALEDDHVADEVTSFDEPSL